jgi:hypothetical protein
MSDGQWIESATLDLWEGRHRDQLNRIEELEAKLAGVIWELKRSNDALEALRPVWAQGWTNDSVAAQASGAALAQLWNMLGVQDQTQAMATLAELKGQGDE